MQSPKPTKTHLLELPVGCPWQLCLQHSSWNSRHYLWARFLHQLGGLLLTHFQRKEGTKFTPPSQVCAFRKGRRNIIQPGSLQRMGWPRQECEQQQGPHCQSERPGPEQVRRHLSGQECLQEDQVRGHARPSCRSWVLPLRTKGLVSQRTMEQSTTCLVERVTPRVESSVRHQGSLQAKRPRRVRSSLR